MVQRIMKFFYNLTWIGICINPEENYKVNTHLFLFLKYIYYHQSFTCK
eukprot:UN21183